MKVGHECFQVLTEMILWLRSGNEVPDSTGLELASWYCLNLYACVEKKEKCMGVVHWVVRSN